MTRWASFGKLSRSALDPLPLAIAEPAVANSVTTWRNAFSVQGPKSNGAPQYSTIVLRNNELSIELLHCNIHCWTALGLDLTAQNWAGASRNSGLPQNPARKKPDTICIGLNPILCGSEEETAPFYDASSPLFRQGPLIRRSPDGHQVHCQTSIFRAYSAFDSMKARRGSTSSPIRVVNISSAAMASSICTRSRRRTVGSMVVSHN